MESKQSLDWRWSYFTTDIELTNFCSQNCLFCPREKMARPSGFIELELLKKILLQLAAINSRVTFCGMGTPLLHPKFPEIMEFCRQLKGFNFGLTIQAPALDPEGLKLLEISRPGFIEISFPTIDSELFSRIYPGCDLETSLENVLKLFDLDPPLRGINIIAIRTARENFSDDEIRSFWQERGFNCRITKCHSRGGNLNAEEVVAANSRSIKRCGLFAAHSFITWQGKVLACCHDLDGNSEIADLNKHSIQFAGEQKLEIINNAMPFSMCKSCDEPAAERRLPQDPYPLKPKARRKIMATYAQY